MNSFTSSIAARISILARISAVIVSVVLLSAAFIRPVSAQQWPNSDADQTMKVMHDELERSRNMQMTNLQKPYFIQYRLLDLDVRTITASFGALVSTSTTHNRFM